MQYQEILRRPRPAAGIFANRHPPADRGLCCGGLYNTAVRVSFPVKATKEGRNDGRRHRSGPFFPLPVHQHISFYRFG